MPHQTVLPLGPAPCAKIPKDQSRFLLHFPSMTCLTLPATPGTSLFLSPTEYGISISLENTGGPLESSCSINILLTNCNGGLRLNVVRSDVSASRCISQQGPSSVGGDDGIVASDISNMHPFYTGLSLGTSDYCDMISLNPLPLDPGAITGDTPFSMDWDSVTASSPRSSGSLPSEVTNLPPSHLSGTFTTASHIEGTNGEPPRPESDSSSPPSPNSDVAHHSSYSNVILPCRHANCKKTFKREHMRDRHEAAHVDIFCTFPNCGTMFKRKHDRMRHEYLQHGKAINLCGGCSKTFLSAQNLKRHVCSHFLR